ncbi:hypothetical protein VP01_711g9 [Puccinia sorghi]|uniref:NADH dehydrogenase [ubiquinone] 1 alpha subcomplex assembly factor 3 n=1 Tax=Puccinia sorghi TaxID=27349 RepID=A0A0L6UDI9_9BASI|nr:hypothetical protein VP01_711g9 [Puccinia sorghi]
MERRGFGERAPLGGGLGRRKPSGGNWRGRVGVIRTRTDSDAGHSRTSSTERDRAAAEEGTTGELGVRTVHRRAFTLSNHSVVPANLMLFAGQGLLWHPSCLAAFYPHLHPNDEPNQTDFLRPFKLFELLAPRPEMLIFGAGHSILTIPPPTIASIKRYLNALGIQLDVLDTRNACANYNLLVEEGRSVAGLFLTLDPIDSRTAKPLS